MTDKSATARDYRSERDGATWVIRSPSAGVTLSKDGKILRYSSKGEADAFAQEVNSRLLGPGSYLARFFGKR